MKHDRYGDHRVEVNHKNPTLTTEQKVKVYDLIEEHHDAFCL